MNAISKVFRPGFIVVPIIFVGVVATMEPSLSADRPFSTADLFLFKWLRPSSLVESGIRPGNTGGQFSSVQFRKYQCRSEGDPATAVDMSCDDLAFGQNFAPDNEISIAVNPDEPDHLVAGSNDGYYRFNNSTGARQFIGPTGFFTSFDGGETWLDGQIPAQKGNIAGDPSPAFDRANGVVLMAQLENVGGHGGPFIVQGDVSVSRSADGGITWSRPVVVLKGHGAGIGPANRAVFFDKEWLTVDNNVDSAYYGRAYLTATMVVNGLHGSFARAPIVLSYSDDGGVTWTTPVEISGSHPSCSYQASGPSGECDEDQFSIPEVAPDGTLYVHFVNSQNQGAWEWGDLLDSQIMVVKSSDGGQTISAPVQAVQLEDGLSDMPFSVIGSQTIWGHQIRWNAIGNLSVNPMDSDDVTIVFADRGESNMYATPWCFIDMASGGLNIGTAPDYDPCHAKMDFDTNVYMVRSYDGGATWTGRILVDDGEGAPQWFPWADHMPDGTLVVAWDEDTIPAPADSFRHVLFRLATNDKEALGLEEHVDVGVTHWSGDVVPPGGWPSSCGPMGYADPPVDDAEGKDCIVFHGDYTGLAVGPDGSINVVWTGLNQRAVSIQADGYTGELHDGYVQDAMFARR